MIEGLALPIGKKKCIRSAGPHRFPRRSNLEPQDLGDYNLDKAVSIGSMGVREGGAHDPDRCDYERFGG